MPAQIVFRHHVTDISFDNHNPYVKVSKVVVVVLENKLVNSPQPFNNVRVRLYYGINSDTPSITWTSHTRKRKSTIRFL